MNKQPTTPRQSTAQASVIKVRQQMQDLHDNYSKELTREKKQAQQELQWIQQQSTPVYSSTGWYE
jgi:hypothetical protein